MVPITENESKYLKLIYRKQREESDRIKTTSLAEALGVKPSSVTEMLRNLSEKELLQHELYHGVKLTERGESRAKKLLRKHRIIEVLLVDLLGYSPERACIEASEIDYHVSLDLVNSICSNYGHPELCPCGKTISRDPACSGKEGEGTVDTG